jgi:hypothetical protein
MKEERFYISSEESGAGSTYSPVIKDKENNDEIVCETIEDTLKFLNELTSPRSLFTLSHEQLIGVKEQIQGKIESKYFELITNESELKNVENSLWLNTDFKAQGLTNDSLRRAFVSDNTSKIRFKIDMAKYELKQLENHIIIINDLIKLRQQEVKQE